MSSFIENLANMVLDVDENGSIPLPYKKAFTAGGWNGIIWLHSITDNGYGVKVTYSLPEQSRARKTKTLSYAMIGTLHRLFPESEDEEGFVSDEIDD